jgi:hypothetical protein
MVGLGWVFKDWNGVEELSKKEPFDKNGVFCRKGEWEKNNPQFAQGNAAPCDDPRAYLSYPWPDGSKAKLLGTYEVVTGAWCYGRNMSMSLEATLAINGNEEWLDGAPEPNDCDYGLRLCNYGMVALLDRGCCVYEYSGADNTRMQDVLPFTWGHIGVVNNVKVTRGEFQLWAIMKTPSRWKSNAYFNLREMREEFRKTAFTIEF